MKLQAKFTSCKYNFLFLCAIIHVCYELIHNVVSNKPVCLPPQLRNQLIQIPVQITQIPCSFVFLLQPQLEPLIHYRILASFPGSPAQLQCLRSRVWEPGNETNCIYVLREPGNKANCIYVLRLCFTRLAGHVEAYVSLPLDNNRAPLSHAVGKPFTARVDDPQIGCLFASSIQSVHCLLQWVN